MIRVISVKSALDINVSLCKFNGILSYVLRASRQIRLTNGTVEKKGNLSKATALVEVALGFV